MAKPVAGQSKGPKMRGIEANGEPAESVVEILDCAAQCFMEMGFQGTSIDDVARRLGATKGRIYYYYPSKANLFFDVHREGMDRLMKAVQSVMVPGARGADTLLAMIEAHALTMMQNIAYEAVVVQGVHMHRLGATTPEQREILEGLMTVRRQFEQLFAQTVRQGQADGSLNVGDVSICVKSILGAVNWMAIWYRPRADEPPGHQRRIAQDVARQQIFGLLRPVDPRSGA